MLQRTSSLPQGSVRFAGHAPGWRRLAAGLIGGLAALWLGVLAGAALTRFATHRDLDAGATALGAWSIAPDAGTPGIDPYRRARLSRTAEVPMAVGQGVALVARHDDAGRPLDRRCSYRIAGSVPKARFWTLTASDADGLPIPNGAGRAAFTATELLRDAGGAFEIALSPVVQPGNWLPLGGSGGFVLELRLYDTAVLALGNRGLRGLAVPSVTVERCP